MYSPGLQKHWEARVLSNRGYDWRSTQNDGVMVPRKQKIYF